MIEVGQWLGQLGLDQYVELFEQNGIRADVLVDLTDADLRELGISLGDRRRLLKAIAVLREAPPEPPAAGTLPHQGPERRQLTVLFCDLVGSTALSARLDPEDMSEVVREYQACCTNLIERFDGHVAKYMGDGLLAYFGYPQAHENDAERAVHAGLGIAEAVPQLKSRQDTGLQVRIGIATGLVIVGELIGTGTAQERTVVGETPTLAQRLQGLATPGSIVVADGTRRLLGDLFEVEPLGPQALKGFDEAVQPFRVKGVGKAESRFEALHPGSLTPLVGRDQELALLLDRWERAMDGEGQVVLLSGEPGIGKSRIVEALCDRLHDVAHRRLRYYCSPYHQNSVLHPVIQQLERAAGYARADTSEQELAKLEALLTLSTNNVAAVAPLFARLLSISAGDRYPPLNLSPRQQKEKTLEALADQLPGLATVQPVLLIWEDAHWADPTSLELLDLVVDCVQSIPVLVIITFRPEFAARWTGYTHVTPLVLNRLSRKQAATMIQNVTSDKALPHEVFDQIIAKTDGVPLFVEELTKTVLESGLLKDAGNRYTLAGPLPPLAIPATLQDSLLARLDRLAPVKEVAQIGAVIGREFSYELLAAVTAQPPKALRQALADLVKSELVFGHGPPPYASYTFKHALVQDAAYGSLLRSKRQQWHSRIARVLEDRFSEIADTQPELLAHHFTQAGFAEQAVVYWQRAGELAITRSALVEAVAHLTQGLEALKNLPDTVGHQRCELGLQISLGSAIGGTKGLGSPQAGRTWERARELCGALGESTQLPRLLFGQFTFHMARAEFSRAQEAGKELVHAGEAQGDTLAQSNGHFAIGESLFHLGELVQSSRHHNQALALYDPTRHQTLVFVNNHDSRVESLSYLSNALLILGYPDQAQKRSCEALVAAQKLSHPCRAQ
jgi:class 3 adenylate cyclase/tetratricopeptide (TPR) repeat protein